MCKTCGGRGKTSQLYNDDRPPAYLPDPTNGIQQKQGPTSRNGQLPQQYLPGLAPARIDSIVIHNYGVINMLPMAGSQPDQPVYPAGYAPDRKRMATELLSRNATASADAMNIHAMGFGSDDQTATISIQNTWPVKLSKVKLRHQYSDWRVEEKMWDNVEPYASTAADFQVSYQTGWATGASTDSWWCEVTFAESNITFKSAEKYCMMREDDKSSNGSLTFKLEANKFVIGLRSGGCDAELDNGDFGFNAFTFFRAKNSLPVEAVLKVDHKYSDDTGEQNSHWDNIAVSVGTYTPYTTAFFMTGATHWGFDHFKVTAWPRLQPPANAPELQDKALSGDWFRYTLRDEDRGHGIDCEVGPWGYQFRGPSGVYGNSWDSTPAGYNTTAWIQIQNDFTQDIRYVVLKHRYSTDTAYEYDYEDIPARSISNQSYMVEYFTGTTHAGFDYWDITVFLKDGSYYTNNTAAKECYLTRSDSRVLTFSVKEDNFHLGLSDGCDDGMSSRGKVDYLLGADINRPYAWNCFLAAHNAFATEASGSWLINNQSLSLSNQLALGATTLLLDIYWKDSDIWMLHAANEFHSPIVNRPWNHLETLKDGLRAIAAFLNRFQDAVVTIVFEDGLEDDNGPQHAVLRSRFAELGLWDQIFFPSDAMKTDASQWPSLSTLRAWNKRLLCMTSKKNSNLPYQWDYMTETVYGDDSLNPQTWTKKRGESKDPGTLATFAVNHFPTMSVVGNLPIVGSTYHQAQTNNEQAKLQAHINACVASPGGIPNWLNLDYIEVGWCSLATAYCNARFKEKHTVRATALAAVTSKAPDARFELVESRFVKKLDVVENTDAEQVNGVRG